MRLTRAIVRGPASSFAAGITSAVGGGPPDVKLALVQHARYCEALRDCGLQITTLEPAEEYPDSTFVEDTAVMTSEGAIVTRPGAASRRAEAPAMLLPLSAVYDTVREIKSPGTLDGGDVCEADGKFFIGVSERTNEEGARQLAFYLSEMGHASATIDIRGCEGLLHLKTGMSYLGEGVFVAVDVKQVRDALRDYDLVTIPRGEEYAANCVRINNHLLAAAGYPQFLRMLRARGNRVIALDMSEFKKMDGGLSCLSLRF